jgi:hypothetical protein
MNRIEYLLTCFGEECAEAAQRASKASRFGVREIQPGQDLTNAERLIREHLEAVAVVEMLQEAGALPIYGEMARQALIDAKKAKVIEFMRYSAKLGTLVNVQTENGNDR